MFRGALQLTQWDQTLSENEFKPYMKIMKEQSMNILQISNHSMYLNVVVTLMIE